MTAPAARTRARFSDLALASLGAFAFGCTILFQRGVARDGLPAPTALTIRFGIAGALLLLALRALGRPLLPPGPERRTVALLGFVLYAFESSFFYMGLERGTAAAVALIFYAYPAVVAVAEVVLGAARPRASVVVALLLSVAGSVAIAAGGGRVAISATGVAFVCGSIGVFSTYVIVSDRRLVRTDSLTAAAWTAVGAAAGISIYGLATRQLESPTAGALAAIVATAGATATAFTLFFVVLARIGPTRTAIVMALEAVTSVVLAALFLDEPLRLVVGLGGAAVVTGAVVAALATPASVERREPAASP